MARKKYEQGQSMAWTAILLSLVLVPLLILVVDGTRLFRVRSRLQTAVDAACEDAAWSAADRARFREDGETTYADNWHTWSVAHTTFQNVLVDQGAMEYYPSMRVYPDLQNAIVSCDAQANVPLVIGGALQSSVDISVSSVSQIRFRR